MLKLDLARQCQPERMSRHALAHHTRGVDLQLPIALISKTTGAGSPMLTLALLYGNSPGFRVGVNMATPLALRLMARQIDGQIECDADSRRTHGDLGTAVPVAKPTKLTEPLKAIFIPGAMAAPEDNVRATVAVFTSQQSINEADAHTTAKAARAEPSRHPRQQTILINQQISGDGEIAQR